MASHYTSGVYTRSKGFHNNYTRNDRATAVRAAATQWGGGEETASAEGYHPARRWNTSTRRRKCRSEKSGNGEWNRTIESSLGCAEAVRSLMRLSIRSITQDRKIIRSIGRNTTAVGVIARGFLNRAYLPGFKFSFLSRSLSFIILPANSYLLIISPFRSRLRSEKECARLAPRRTPFPLPPPRDSEIRLIVAREFVCSRGRREKSAVSRTNEGEERIASDAAVQGKHFLRVPSF